MKKTLLLLSTAALLLAGCAKEKFAEPSVGGLTDATFTASVDGGVATKAVADNDGNGAYVNRCIMEIYFQNELYKRLVESTTSGVATFANVPVVAGKEYKILFWADCGGEELADKYYTTTDLKTVTVAKEAFIAALKAGDNDKLDAFFFADNYNVPQAGGNYAATLKRPFAQLNVITTDVGEGKTVTSTALLPEKVSVSYTAAKSINVATGEISGTETYAYEAHVYGAWSDAKTELTLSMDYILASTEQGAVDVTFKTKNGSTEVMSHALTNLPYKRNYRTNIKGALLTTTGDWTATIVPGWNQPDEEVAIIEAGSVAAANEAFANGATRVKITSVGEETTLYLPVLTDEVTIDFANPSEVITVKYGPAPTKAAGDKPAAVNIATNDLTKFTVSGISNIVWLAGNQAALASALNNAVAGQTVALANDITMTENWVSVARGSNTPNFDGRNHAIINMTVKTQEESYAGLFSTIGNHVILQNVTFRNALIDIPASVGDDARGGILVGHMYPCDVINCHVEGATIKAHQKMGGLIGYVEGDAANKSISIKDCSVKDITLSSNVQGSKTVAGVGGFIGHLVLSQADLITVENNSVENIIITDSKPITGSYNWNEYGQYLPHAFVGNACQNYKGGEPVSESKHSILFANNRILGTNTELSTCIYSSEYFGWGGNAEEMPSWTGKIYIDGQEWTPSYPVKIVGGQGYATLAEALTAATEGQTVQILKAGEYTFPGNTKKAVTVEGLNEKDADGNYVVAINLNGVSEYNENLTFKHMTFNFTNSEGADRGFTHCVNMTYNECTFTGLMWGYDSQVSTFNDCLFHQATKYNVWSYGGNLEFNRCLFQTSTGTIVNVYATGTDIHEVRFNDCTFESLTDVLDKGAILLKGGKNHGHVIVDNYTLKGKFQNNGDSAKYINSADGLYMFSLRDGDFSDAVYITVNGVTHYPYFTIDANGDYHVNSVAGLRTAIEHYNKLSTTGEFKIFVANGTYEVSDMFVMQHKDLSLTIKAEEKGKAIFKLNDDTKTKIFFLLDNPTGDLNFGTEYFTVDGINFQIPSNPTIELGKTDVYVIYGVTANSDPYVSVIRPGYTPKRYMHNINMLNCKVEGFGTQNLSVIYSSENFQRILVENCDIASVGYVTNGNGDDISLINTKVSGTKTCLNCNDPHGRIIVEGCNISTYHDCCLRAGQNAVIKNNTFNITYSGTATDAAVICFRGATGPFEATITGNTFNKSADMKYDVFVKSNSGPWTINKGTSFMTVIEKGKGEETIRQQ